MCPPLHFRSDSATCETKTEAGAPLVPPIPSTRPHSNLLRRSELDEDSEEERKRALAANKQQAAFVDVQNMDDEVERVLGWRCAGVRS